MRQIRISSFLILFGLGLAYAANSPDDNLPINVTSNAATIDLNAGTATYNGSVIATQGTRKLTGNSLVVQRATNGKIQSFTAQGSPATSQEQPTPTSKMAYGQAKTIYYYPQQGLVKYVNNAKFTQGGNIFTGDLITYNTNTQVVSSPQTKGGTGTTTIILPAYNQEGSSGS